MQPCGWPGGRRGLAHRRAPRGGAHWPANVLPWPAGTRAFHGPRASACSLMMLRASIHAGIACFTFSPGVGLWVAWSAGGRARERTRRSDAMGRRSVQQPGIAASRDSGDDEKAIMRHTCRGDAEHGFVYACVDEHRRLPRSRDTLGRITRRTLSALLPSGGPCYQKIRPAAAGSTLTPDHASVLMKRTPHVATTATCCVDR